MQTRVIHTRNQTKMMTSAASLQSQCHQLRYLFILLVLVHGRTSAISLLCISYKGKELATSSPPPLHPPIPLVPPKSFLPQKGISRPQLYLLVFGGGGTSDDLDQLASNDGLSGSVEKNLVPVDHLAGVLGGIVHSVATGRLLAGVALSQTPEDGVGKGVLLQVGEDLLVSLEGGEVLWIKSQP